MKKVLLVAGVVAAIVGATRLFGRKHNEEEAMEAPAISANGYAPQPLAE